MTDRPILFSGPMVRALLAGTKTQTRRIIKAGRRVPEFCGGRYDDRNDPSCWGWEDCELGEWITLDQWNQWNFVPCRIGDRLYVREAWRTWESVDHMSPRDLTRVETIQYEADGLTDNCMTMSRPGRFRQGMHMPRWASRLTLTVTDVRVQRVQEISVDDAIAEGRPKGGEFLSARSWFRDLWDSLNGPRGYGWDANPWVAAYTFTVERRNIDDKDT